MRALSLPDRKTCSQAEPRYLVTAAPWVNVPREGFFYPGDVFYAPPDWIPPRTLRALNDEAAERLAAAFKAHLQQLREHLAVVHGADRTRVAGEIRQAEADHARATVVLTPEEASALSSNLAASGAQQMRGA